MEQVVEEVQQQPAKQQAEENPNPTSDDDDDDTVITITVTDPQPELTDIILLSDDENNHCHDSDYKEPQNDVKVVIDKNTSERVKVDKD